MYEETDKTPIVPPWEEMRREISEIKKSCEKAYATVRENQDRIPLIEKRLERIILFQAWFPTTAVVIALLYQLLRK